MFFAVGLLFLLTFVKDLDARPEKCASPFVYENAVFFGCTTLGGTEPWCALTPIYQTGRWKYCDDDDILDERSNTKYLTKDCGRRGCCSFPFEYGGKLFDGCKKTFGLRPWCSLDRIYKGSWKYCTAKDNQMAEDYQREKAAKEMQIQRGGQKALEQKETEKEDGQEEDTGVLKEIPTLGGTANGAKCALPFTYYGRTYNNCTTFRAKQPWCSTTEKYSGQWGLCVFITEEQKAKVVYTAGGTVIQGSRCHFPFLYRGQVYTDCTTTLHGTPWCSTDEKYQGRWGECVPDVDNIVHNSVAESSAVAEETQECVIPFSYNGVVYYGCTTLNSDYAWCSLTEEYFGQWKMCTGEDLKSQQREMTPEPTTTLPDTTIPTTAQPETDSPKNFKAKVFTTGGSAGGAPCALPFVYKGKMYTSCTSDHWSQPWCSTTTHYRGMWGRCLPESTTQPPTHSKTTPSPLTDDEETTTKATPTDRLLASVPVKSTKHCKQACENYQQERCDYVNVGPRKRVGGTVMCELWAGRAKKRVGFTMHRVRY
ncbi:uncharacterized protein LOC118410597 isoform X2 [Branchiostoma floridae]|uniref:Uncharacterized protein LOC118410597 isoform X2 n=1 Tax=Branchiostoma floridae TaxID=7739 RepID=A0A9J7KRP9_BRAFL|nr:uncharacterized protein LOC118410597 isoform X2 [Branchiostoma floridae]